MKNRPKWTKTKMHHITACETYLKQCWEGNLQCWNACIRNAYTRRKVPRQKCKLPTQEPIKNNKINPKYAGWRK